MVESHTVKKSRRRSSRKKHKSTESDVRDLEIAADLAVAYIKHWAREEATAALITNRDPLIIPMGNGYRVGRFSVAHLSNETWQVQNRVGEVVSAFLWKSAAVAYCMLEHLGRFQQAREILILDNRMLKLSTDLAFYKKSIENSARKKDVVKTEFVWNRYLQAQAQFNSAKNNLEKSLKSTKYLKVWDPKS
jgi:hypothetical protein